MERARFALIAALALLVISAAPAFAQRDPFEPIDTGGNSGSSSGDTGGSDDPFTQPGSSDSGDSGTTGDNSSDPNQPETNPAPDNDPEVQPDSLPNTGAEPISWLVVAYTLIAVGGGFMVAGRFLHPAFVQRSDIPRRYQPRHSKRRTR